LDVTPKFPLSGTVSILGLVLAYNLMFTFFPRQIEERLRRMPPLILLDVAFCVFLLGIYGWRSPFFLYTFAPVLLGGYLWQLRGGLVVAFFMGISYLSVQPINGYHWSELRRLGFLDTHISHSFDYFLIATFFSYPTFLLARLNRINNGLFETRSKLEASKRKLETLQEVTAAIQASLELNKILKKIVVSLVRHLNYDNAAIGLVEDRNNDEIEWLFSEPDANLCFELEKNFDSPFFSRLLETKKPLSRSDINPADKLTKIIKTENLAAFPLVGQNQKVLGVLLVFNLPPNKIVNVSDFELLRSFAQQASIAIDNAQRYSHSREDGIFGERLRIATEMHDNIIQNLYGIKLFLGACINEADENTPLAKRLKTMRKVFDDTLKDLRFIIDDLYEEQMGRRKLKQLIKELAFNVEKTSNIRVGLSMFGKEQGLSPKIKKDTYLIIREAISNAQKHAQAHLIKVEVAFSPTSIELRVADDGSGFCLKAIRAGGKGGLGLKTIESRARAHNGRADIESYIGKGTEVIIFIPISKKIEDERATLTKA